MRVVLFLLYLAASLTTVCTVALIGWGKGMAAQVQGDDPGTTPAGYGVLVVLFAAGLSLFRPRAGALVGTGGCALLWCFFGPYFGSWWGRPKDWSSFYDWGFVLWLCPIAAATGVPALWLVGVTGARVLRPARGRLHSPAAPQHIPPAGGP
jgi:hypothetical protein